MDVSDKQKQFNAAMELYTSKGRYRILALSVSILNISLQLLMIYLVWPLTIGPSRLIFSFLLAYVLTDFINGLVHMYMDNNDRYDSLAGPLIANFHLHHRTPQYKKHNLLVVYFHETGSKIWLVGYLVLVVLFLAYFDLDPTAAYTLMYIGILSSVAEVSHYLCHSSTASAVVLLENCGLLLSKRHHAAHHLQDNSNYAFLNGVSDPLLNRIASTWYKGYKQNSDLHFAGYECANDGTR